MVTPTSPSNPLPSIVEIFANTWVPLRTPLLLKLTEIVEKSGTPVVDIVYIVNLIDYLVEKFVLEARLGEDNVIELRKIEYNG